MNWFGSYKDNLWRQYKSMGTDPRGTAHVVYISLITTISLCIQQPYLYSYMDPIVTRKMCGRVLVRNR